VSREFALLISPRELLDTSVAQLRVLTAFLHDHLSAEGPRAGSLPETRVCEELMRSLDELIAIARDSQGD
jgi:hypothetical protein